MEKAKAQILANFKASSNVAEIEGDTDDISSKVKPFDPADLNDDDDLPEVE
jgi:hypothetical protein